MTKKLDPTKHGLVPKHTVLSDSEREELFTRYKITFFDLPRILKTDPGIEHLNAKIGDIIKIVRKSRTAGEAVYFRGIVKSTASSVSE